MKQEKDNYLAIGMLIGVLIGVFLDNIGLWLSLGLAFGCCLEYTKKSKNDK